jgi:hypothetical protein
MHMVDNTLLTIQLCMTAMLQKQYKIKLSVKSAKDGTGTPCLVTYGSRFQKTGKLNGTLGFIGA